MKDNNYKYRLLIKIFLFTFFVAFISLPAQISWMGNEYTSPSLSSNTFYLGDRILFEIQMYPNYNTSTPSGAQLYIDWNNNGYGTIQNEDWYALNYVGDSGNNSKWNSYINLKYLGTHNRKYLGWKSGSSDYVTSNFGTFVVNPLNTPVSPSASAISGTQINLSWNKDAQNHNVMIVRSTINSFTAPTQGTAYSVGATIGSGTVIYNNSGTSFSDTGLACNTTYYYAFYSENYFYYSVAVNANATTLNAVPTIDTQPSTTAQNLCQNTAATALTVGVSGLGLSYQWYSNSSASNSGGTLISGANSSSYTPPTNTVGTKYYYVVVSGTCGAPVTSNVSGAIIINNTSSAVLSSAVGTDNQTLLNDATPIANITYALVNISNANVSGLPTGVSGNYSGNTFTISGTPTQVGTFNYSIAFTANCGSVANLTGTIKVNSYLVEYVNIQSPKKPQTILLGDQFDVYAQVKITGITDAPGYGSGASGWLGYSTTNTNPNIWTHWTAISYNPNYDTSPSYQIANDEYYYIDFVNNENLEGGTYYYASRFQRNGSSEYIYGGTDEVDTNFSGGIWGTTNANGKVNVSGVVKVVDEVIWDGTQWKWFDDDEGTSGAWKTIPEPNQKLKAKIEGNYPASAPSFTCKKLTIDNGVSVTIGAGKYIRVMNEIVNNNADVSLFTVESDGNLIQVNDASINTGNITVKRNAQLKRLDYNYWGSPVEGQNIRSFSPGTLPARFYTYNEADDYFYWVDPYVNSFEKGKGYAIRASNTAATTPETFEGRFVGVPNNGMVAVSLAYTDADHGYNLIANPYPSNIDFSQFYALNSDKLYHVAYFWTNVNPNPPMQGSNYPNGGYLNNYAVFNGSGGIPALMVKNNSTESPNQYVKVGQGFIVKSKVAGTAQFFNSVRTDDTSAVFFNKNVSIANKTDRFWLTLSTPLEIANKILIAYKKEATNGFELDYDAPPYLISTDCFYSILENQKLAIQGRAYPLLTDDVVPLGASYYADGNYTIALAEKEGVFTKQPIYLIDLKERKTTNLSETSYTFFAQKGIDDSRFQIVYQYNSGYLGAQESNALKVKIFTKAQQFVVDAPSQIKNIKITDSSGKISLQYSPVANYFEIEVAHLPIGIYYLEVETTAGKVHKKLMKK